MLAIIGVLALSACGGESSSASNNDSITGVATAAQISVVTAK
jgi:hypothetical protein